MGNSVSNVVCVVLGLVLLGVSGVMLYDEQELASAGVVTTATVVEKLDEPGSKGGRLYSLAYVFAATASDGSTVMIRNTRQVAQARYDQTQVGDQIAVRYLLRRSGRNDIEGNASGALAPAIPGGLLLLAGLVSIGEERAKQPPSRASDGVIPRLFRRRRSARISTESLRRLERDARQRERRWR